MMMQNNSPITDSEMERRWNVTRAVMEAMGLDAIVAQAREDWVGSYVRWLTDIPTNNGYPRTVVFFRDRPMTVIEMGPFGGDLAMTGDPVNRGVGRMLHTPSFVSVGYTTGYDAELLLTALNDARARRIGLLCPGALPYDLVAALKQADPAFDLADATDALDTAKAVKSAEEISLLRKTAALQDTVFAEVCDFIRPGVTDREVSAHAEAVGRRLGSDQGICLGRSAPMGSPSRFLNRPFQTREMAQGDHRSILIEINGPGGLYTEIARTMVLGKADNHLLASFENVRAAQDHTLALIRPGAKPSEIAASHDAWIAARSLPCELRLYAHGQGVRRHVPCRSPRL
jgi:Xaa-Pro aminopeptidase